MNTRKSVSFKDVNSKKVKIVKRVDEVCYLALYLFAKVILEHAVTSLYEQAPVAFNTFRRTPI